MAKNITYIMLERLAALEREQARLAQLQLDAAIAAGNTEATLDDFIKSAVTNWVINETPVGAVDGVNKIFNIENSPTPGGLQVYLEGVLLEQGLTKDYTVSNGTFNMNYAPPAGWKITCTYEFEV